MKIDSLSTESAGRRKIAWQLPLALFVILTLNTTVLQIANVVSTAGFIRQVGIEQLPLLWIVDMIITLVATGVYSLIIDRLARSTLMGGLLVGLALVYIGLQALFTANAPSWITYPLLYLMSDQQFVLFPLAFWALANDLYSTSDAKHIFPIITTGTVAGSLLGNGVTVLLASQSTSALLILAAVLLLMGFLILWVAIRFRRVKVRARQARNVEVSFRETLSVGLEFFRNVSSFRFLTLAMLFGSISLTILEFHFLATLDGVARQSENASAQFQSIYGAYRMIFFIATWLFQWVIASRLLSKVKLQNTFLWLPITLTLAAASAIGLPGFIGGGAARFVARVVQRGWEEPARKIFQGLVPDEKRGRVSAFMDSYIYAVATIIGCIILIIALILARSLPAPLVTAGYLAIAAFAGVGSFVAVLKMRVVFEESLLNWRFARSRRKSVLDKIEF